MIKAKGRELLGEHGFRYITSMTDPEIRKALASGLLQLSLFDEDVAEVVSGDRRYILRRNPAMTARTRSRRADQFARVQAKVDARNALVATSKRADPQVSLRSANKWLKTYKLDKYVSAELHDRVVHLVVDHEAQRELESLDGCYVVTTDVPVAHASAQEIWDRYGDLQKVERNFRTMKTAGLQLRPIFLRKANRTRAHAFVTMLALKITRELERRVAPLGLTWKDALDRLQAVRLVTLADPNLGLWRLPTTWATEQREVLDVLPRLPPPRLSLHPAGGVSPKLTVLPWVSGSGWLGLWGKIRQTPEGGVAPRSGWTGRAKPGGPTATRGDGGNLEGFPPGELAAHRGAIGRPPCRTLRPTVLSPPFAATCRPSSTATRRPAVGWKR
ncbi:MAG: hypothetical protein D6683_16205 [Actinomyces sp.]|nr:MAG: hypothetical protein D6683_16205 [Actinomyces sp.]